MDNNSGVPLYTIQVGEQNVNIPDSQSEFGSFLSVVEDVHEVGYSGEVQCDQNDFPAPTDGVDNTDDSSVPRRSERNAAKKKALTVEQENITDEPISLEDAMYSPEKLKWIEAMKSEIKSLEENHYWNSVEKPTGVNVIKTKWVFKKKKEPAAKYDLQIEQMDAVTAFLQAVLKNSHDNYQKHGPNYIRYVGPIPEFVTSDPEIIKHLLTAKIASNKGIAYNGFRYIMGKGLVTMKVNEWQPHRKLMDVALKLPNVIEFIPVFHKKMTKLFAEMDKCHVMENSHDILVLCREYTISISGETMLGRDLDKSLDVKQFAKQITGVMAYISDRSFNIFYKSKQILKLAEKTIHKEARQTVGLMRCLIEEAYNYYATGIRNNPDYLDSHDIAVAKHVSDTIESNILEKDLAISSMMHLFGASFETNSSTLYFTMLMLAMYPEYQGKAYAEICELFPDNDNGEFEMSYEQISQLIYLDMFIKETMRLIPTIPMIGRVVVDGNLTLSNGTVIPEGLELEIDIYELHRSKDIWGPQAEQFNPDNFLPCNVEARHPYAYMPFAKGKRSCIGMRYAEISLRVALAKIIKRYKFSTTAKLENLVLHNHFSLHLASHPPLTIEKRRNLSS
ncbi:probable cytochrome P450 313a4 [Musca autumnalis]|uniref:probable cytochrome P450 313a4 n=1 Tax=Musca autumnalis TaxID=221902 RepID=UPI003CF013EB